MIKVGDKVVSEGGDFGIVRAVRQSVNRVLVRWDFVFFEELDMSAVKKVG